MKFRKTELEVIHVIKKFQMQSLLGLCTSKLPNLEFKLLSLPGMSRADPEVKSTLKEFDSVIIIIIELFFKNW